MKKTLTNLIISMMVLASCQNLETEEMERLSFQATVSETKGSALVSVPDFIAFAYTKDSKNVSSGYMYNERFRKESTKWVSDGRYCKVNSKDSVFIWAIAPADLSGVNLPERNDNLSPIFGYTLPVDISSQSDLILASYRNKGMNEEPVLKFEHILSGLQFALADNGAKNCIIKSITLHDIYTGAVYNHDDGGWKYYNGILDRTIELNRTITSSMGGAVLTQGSNTAMLIPQAFPATASIVILIEEDSVEKTIEVPLTGKAIEKGELTTFIINLNDH